MTNGLLTDLNNWK